MAENLGVLNRNERLGSHLLMETQGTAYFLPDFSIPPVARRPFLIAFTLAPLASLFLLKSLIFLFHLLELLQGLLATASSLNPATGSTELTIFESIEALFKTLNRFVGFVYCFRTVIKGEKT